MYVGGLIMELKIQPSEAWNMTPKEYYTLLNYKRKVINLTAQAKDPGMGREQAGDLLERLRKMGKDV